MCKSEIIKELSRRVYGDTSRKNISQTTKFCDNLQDILFEAIVDDRKVVWNGFFSAEVISKDERHGRNPKTNEIVLFPKVNVIKCRFSQALNDLINSR